MTCIWIRCEITKDKQSQKERTRAGKRQANGICIWEAGEAIGILIAVMSKWILTALPSSKSFVTYWGKTYNVR